VSQEHKEDETIKEWYIGTNVHAVPAASIFKYSEVGGSRLSQNINA
jgi:hypothetical protein